MKKLAFIIFLLVLLNDAFTQSFVGKKTDMVPTGNYTLLDQMFSSYDIYEVDVKSIYNYVKKDGSYSDVHLELGNKYDWNFSIYLRDVRSPDFYMHTPVPDFEVSTYWSYYI